MARLTLTAAASATSSGMVGLQELMVTFAAALATLVSDGATPTQGHVNAVNAAYTPIAAVFAGNFVMDYDRAVLTSPNLIRTAVNAALLQALSIQD